MRKRLKKRGRSGQLAPRGPVECFSCTHNLPRLEGIGNDWGPKPVLLPGWGGDSIPTGERSSMRTRFHLIPNAHLDPVWLWDWREGLNEGLVTCRTILDLMDEDPKMTFIRGEAAVYQHIERFEPETFERIRAMVDAGRWDIVGGTWIQPDTNLPATETFLRQFLDGSGYFHDRFGKSPTVAWAADSFGHSAGMPDILVAAGMESFAFTRPFAGESSAFWWEGNGGARVLAWRPPVGWYGSERDEMPRRLDALLEAATKAGFVNVAVLYGVGNHGGGPTRRQQRDIRTWGDSHRENVELVPSGLHRFFRDLHQEIRGKEIPVHRGELNFCLRGCYSSVARYKYRYRDAERSLARATHLATAVESSVGAPVAQPVGAWESLLFNSFHDILPGTSIERAMDDQCAQLGGILDAVRRTELSAANALAAHADTSVPVAIDDQPGALAFVVLNPEPVPFDGMVEWEGCLDYRPLFAYSGRVDAVPSVLRGPDGKVVPSQRIRVENRFGTDTLPWRDRHVARVVLPAFGWGVYTLGLESNAQVAAQGAVSSESGSSVSNGLVSVDASEDGLVLAWGGRRRALRVTTVEDPYGSWGAMDEAADSLDLQTVRHAWKVTGSRVLESGPLRATLWVRMQGGNSTVDLILRVDDGSSTVSVDVRALWNETGARLKMALQSFAESAVFDVPGGTVCRPAGCGEVPGGRWVKAGDLVWATDSLYGWNLANDGELQATVCRASRYAADASLDPGERPWEPAVDRGELRFQMRLDASGNAPESVSRGLERPVLVQRVSPTAGPGGRTGQLGNWDADHCELLAWKPTRDGEGWVARWHNRSGQDRIPTLDLGSGRIAMPVPAGRIATFQVQSLPDGGCTVRACNAREF